MTLPPEGTLVKTLVITDLVASTRMTEELGDAKSSEIFGKQDRLARDLLVRHNGIEVDKTDGFLLFFDRRDRGGQFARSRITRRSTSCHGRSGSKVVYARHARYPSGRDRGPQELRRGRRSRGANAVEVEGLAKPFTARLMALAGGKQTPAVAQRLRRGPTAPPSGMESDDGELRWVAHGGYLLKGVEDPVGPGGGHAVFQAPRSGSGHGSRPQP